MEAECQSVPYSLGINQRTVDALHINVHGNAGVLVMHPEPYSVHEYTSIKMLLDPQVANGRRNKAR